MKRSNITHVQLERRGITLLFTISMIVLFLMLGTAFVMVANNYHRTAKQRGKRDLRKKDGVRFLEEAFYDAYRGPDLANSTSPLRGQSILEDLYGYGIKGRLNYDAGFQPSSYEALVVLQVDPASFQSIREKAKLENIVDDALYVDGIFNGRVITLASGQAKGYSTRIVSHAGFDTDGDGNSDVLQIVIPRDERGINWDDVGTGDEIVLNGREFSGFGAGEMANHDFDPDGDAIARLVPDIEGKKVESEKASASRPNRIGEPFEELVSLEGYLSTDKSPNEPHDAPDFHNMFLSGNAGPEGNIIPSFHRDRLYDFQYARSSSSEENLTASDIRRFSFRPIHVENSSSSTAQAAGRYGLEEGKFESWFGRFLADGSRDSNVAVNAEEGLDVDSDMDGENDSVWIDIGLADQYDDYGNKYRPLVAYRIVDLDGRLNLNAHGVKYDTASPPQNRFGTNFGVAEISLVGVVGGTDAYDELLDRRYGTDKQAGEILNALTPFYLSSQKMLGHSKYRTGYRFSTGVDIFAAGTIGHPHDSEAMPEYVLFEESSCFRSNPYLSDFGIVGGVGDSHFQIREMEGLLRRGDIDAPLLSSRLSGLSSTADCVTTHSFEIAVPAAPLSIQELLQNRLSQTFAGAELREVYNIFTGDRYVDPETEIAYEMKYISKDMLMGGRFNLITLIGNGIDNDLNGVVDDEAELGLGLESTNIPNVFLTQYGAPEYDLNNDPLTNDASVKSLMAKQLYLLALLSCGEFAPDGYPSGPADEDGNSLSPDELYRQSVAQWAVNVVDFYDPDSTMTVFEYDVYPFDDPRVPGNRVDGDPTTDENDQNVAVPVSAPQDSEQQCVYGNAPPQAPVNQRGIVYGVERPEILITETFAHHDRQSQDASKLGFEVAGNSGNPRPPNEIDWVSGRVPQSSLYVELYHPHRLTTVTFDPEKAQQVLPAELSADLPPETIEESLEPSVSGVDTGILAPDETPVWRIAVHRGPEASDADEHVRTIYFTDPINSKAPDPGHDCFFPTKAPATIEPLNDYRNYLVLGTDGNVGNGEQTFGRLSRTAANKDPTPGDIRSTRAIKLSSHGVEIRDLDQKIVRTVVKRNCVGSIINRYRSGHSGAANTRGLSLSDPDGGYSVSPGNINRTKSADGVTLKMPREILFDDDAPSGNRDEDDMQAIWTNGIKQDDDYQFRVLKLQRLANPKAPFHAVANPYITVDVANVDLLSFNGMHANPLNKVDSSVDDSLGTRHNLVDGGTTLGGIERGEQKADQEGTEAARRQLFRALGRIEATDKSSVTTSQTSRGDGHNFSFRFTDGLAAAANDKDRHETLGGRNASYDASNPYSWLTWNNRPFGNKMELANVPALSAEGIVRYFNRSEAETESISATATADRAFSFFFGDDQFGHLMAFGSVQRNGVPRPNRFDWIWEFVEVPNRFLGSETFLSTRNEDGDPIYVPSGGALKFNLHPPMHTIPNFRYPGKVNLNTVYRASVWKALQRGFGSLDFNTFRQNRDNPKGGTDFGNYYTTAPGAEFTNETKLLRKGAEAGLFRASTTDKDRKLTDSTSSNEYAAGTDVEASAAFRNEIRTRLGIAATTRSNVFAMWITVGYFEVDDFGRLGSEIGSQDDGLVQRNRAFYVVDRSIPVASEPGKNHNVDQAVLVRTIIE